jgi:hypothetical protein
MALAIIPSTAQYITMANPQGIAERDILVYNSTGQLQGVFNSTSTIPLNGSEDYIFSMKPLQTNPLEDPQDWLTNNFFPYIQTYVTALLIGVFLIYLLRRN